jgi:hypothetical protein
LAGDNPVHVSDCQEAPAYMEATDHCGLFLQTRVKAGMALQEASEFFQLMGLEGSLRFHGEFTFAIALAMASLLALIMKASANEETRHYSTREFQTALFTRLALR